MTRTTEQQREWVAGMLAAAQIAERDVDWTCFGKRDIENWPWEGGRDGVRDYRLGLIAARSIAAAIRQEALASQPKEPGE